MNEEKSFQIQPRIIIHGGAGNLTRESVSPEAYDAYRTALLDVLLDANHRLSLPGATSLDISTYAVSLLEDNALFNAGHGAVFTTAGTHELEASVMVSRGYRKRGVGVMKVKKAKNPIKLAREMLIRGEESDGGGAGGHCQLEGETCDCLSQKWGLDIVKPSHFWTRKRWDEHRRGIGSKHDDETYDNDKRRADDGFEGENPGQPGTNSVDSSSGHATIDQTARDWKEYLPQGTVGAVVLDSTGTICVATSTGGMTNKLPGRIGDTPTLGAGFWAEEWRTNYNVPIETPAQTALFPNTLSAIVGDCIPGLTEYMSSASPGLASQRKKSTTSMRAVGMSGTGNGDSFLRLSAVRTTAAIARFSGVDPSSLASGTQTMTHPSLQHAVSVVAGPEGMLKQSAEDRWQTTGEGEGGIIGIDFHHGKSEVVFDFNCGGMWHAYIDEDGKANFGVFQDEK